MLKKIRTAQEEAGEEFSFQEQVRKIYVTHDKILMVASKRGVTVSAVCRFVLQVNTPLVYECASICCLQVDLIDDQLKVAARAAEDDMEGEASSDKLHTPDEARAPSGDDEMKMDCG